MEKMTCAKCKKIRDLCKLVVTSIAGILLALFNL